MREHLKKYFPERFPDGGATPTVSLSAGASTEVMKLRCEETVQRLIQDSAEVKLMIGAMQSKGCKFQLKRHISCEPCGPGCNGGYDPDTNQIVICSNKSRIKNAVMSTMIHEMIHMFDYCRAKMSFSNIEHIACSEIRAANLTYCSPADAFLMGSISLFGLKGGHKYCVKDFAFNSVRAYDPSIEDADIWKAVDNVFPGCYNDMEPIGRRPRNGSDSFKQAYRERYIYGYDGY